MKVLLAGASGQLGRELLAIRPAGVSIEAPDRVAMPLASASKVSDFVSGLRPDLVINAAAYTAVDAAESHRVTAHAVNGLGAGILARAAADASARLIHISTDFVFDGAKARPYLPDDPPRPLGVYGESKLAGERAVRQELPDNSLIVRTSWLYSSHRRNFVTTMLEMIERKESVNVVTDQVGSPTWARSLATAIWKWSSMAEASGTRHFCDAGVASWYDFAIAIGEEAGRLGLIGAGDRRAAVCPIRSADFPTAARRPAFSVLDSFSSWKELGAAPLHWRESLVRMLSESSLSASKEADRA